MSKRATQIITIYDDGTIHVQKLSTAVTIVVSDDEPQDPGDDIETPPKGPGNP